MKKQEIEQALRRASGELPRVNYNAAAHTPVQRMEVHDYITRQTPALRRPRRWVPMVAAACLVLLLGGGGWYWWAFRMVYSTLYLDVNPSFTITLNREDKVLDVTGRNADAEAVLEGRSYRDWTLEALLGVLSDDMTARGYLTAETDDDAVIVSVDSRSGDRAKVLKIETEEFFSERLDALDDLDDADDHGDNAKPSPAPSPTATPVAVPTPGVVPTPKVTPTPGATLAPTPAPSHHVEKPSGYERITPSEAKDVILAKEPSANIHDTKLDQNDDGTWVYEIECYVGEDKYDAEVDAIAGTLLLWELDG